MGNYKALSYAEIPLCNEIPPEMQLWIMVNFGAEMYMVNSATISIVKYHVLIY